MKYRLFIYSYIASSVFLAVFGSLGLAGLLLAGASLHGEPIGGKWGILAAPVFAIGGSLLILLIVAVPLCALFQWLFDKFRWRQSLRWWLIPCTGPILFCVMAPLFWTFGEDSVFSALALSVLLGIIVSIYWAAVLIFEKMFLSRKLSQS